MNRGYVEQKRVAAVFADKNSPPAVRDDSS